MPRKSIDAHEWVPYVDASNFVTMRCLYEVLDVESTADASVIKKQYRKLALQWHPGMLSLRILVTVLKGRSAALGRPPADSGLEVLRSQTSALSRRLDVRLCHADKNSNNEDAQERFQEIQNAWEVLSDPQVGSCSSYSVPVQPCVTASTLQERAWYDSHRNQILSSGSRHQAGAGGDGPSEPPDAPINFAFYTTTTCYAGFEGDDKGFYAVYRAVFDVIAEQEQAAHKRQKAAAGAAKMPAPPAAPSLGVPSSSEDFVRDFYAFWSNFQTVKDFAWLDVYNASAAPGRRVRRLMEAENAKARKAGKLAFVADVRELVRWVRAQDVRMEAFSVRSLLPVQPPLSVHRHRALLPACRTAPWRCSGAISVSGQPGAAERCTRGG